MMDRRGGVCLARMLWLAYLMGAEFERVVVDNLIS